MKRDIPTPTIVAICVALGIVLVLIGWTVFAGHGDRIDSATIQAHMKLKSSKEDK